MRIDRLGLKNFRCFDEFELVFSPEFNMHVIVAENMAGKSALFQALRLGLGKFVGSMTGDRTEIAFGDHRIIGQNPLSDVALNCSIDLTAHIPSAGNFRSLHWGLSKQSPKGKTSDFDPKGDAELRRLARDLYEYVTELDEGLLPLFSYFGTEYVHVASSSPREEGDFQALLGYHTCLSGKSIEPFLLQWYARMEYRVHETQRSKTIGELFGGVPAASLSTFEHVLRSLLPSITEFVWLTAGGAKQREEKKLAFRFEDNTIRLFDQLSDGFQYLALIAAELSMRAVLLNKHLGSNAHLQVTGVVLIDEFGIHLHPELQAATLKGLAAAFPKVQFIISTHSPMLLNGLDADQVYLLEVDAQGKRHVRHPARDLVGIGAEGILRDVFGMQSTFDVATIAAVKEHAALHRKSMSGELNEVEKQQFASLTQQLSAVAYDDSLQDPLYHRFLKMIAERNSLSQLTEAETLPSDAEMQAMVDRLLSEMNNSSPANPAMIYIRFPHPALESHPKLVKFLTKAAPQDDDWLDLMDWLEAHQYVSITGQGGGKCWYSEQPIAGKGDREVEHFRPKMGLKALTKLQRDQLQKKNILQDIEPYLEESGAGYPWLRFKPSNYRLSSASVNMQGSKGSIFPVLKGSPRIQDPSDAFSHEYAILFDPCCLADAESLTLNMLGEIIPAFEDRLNPAIDLPSQWTSDAMRWLRAEVSIVVYDLNNPAWIRCRKDIYDKVVKDIADLRMAIETNNDPLMRKCKEILEERARRDAPFSRAARVAMEHQIIALGRAQSLAEALTAKLLKEIQSLIRRADHP